MRFNVHYHTIVAHPYDHYSNQDKIFLEYQKKGYVGLTTSETSPWELREIRRWIKKQKKYIYMNRNDVFYTTDQGGYVDNCNCYWFSDSKQEKDFIKLLDSFPERKYEIDFEAKNSEHYYIVKQAFKKKRYTTNCRFIERDEEYPERAVIQFSDQADAMAFKLKWC